MPNTWQLQKKTKQGDGQMTNPIDPAVLDLNEQLDEIIRQLQLACEEFEALEAKLAAREAQNEPNH
jgi:hypothetical protein